MSVESELEFGYAYMRNHSMFHCNEPVNNALRDAGEYSRRASDAESGAESTYRLDNQDVIAHRSHLVYQFMQSLHREKAVNIHQGTDTWSVGGKYVMSRVFTLHHTPFDVIVSNDIGGFYGERYRDLSFGFINNTALALLAPVELYGYRVNVNAGCEYLASDNAHGVMFMVELR